MYLQGVQNTVRYVFGCLHLLTSTAVHDELFDILLQCRPEVILSDEVKGLHSPGVSSSRDVMVVLDDS
jgi:hypothetical protein